MIKYIMKILSFKYAVQFNVGLQQEAPTSIKRVMWSVTLSLKIRTRCISEIQSYLSTTMMLSLKDRLLLFRICPTRSGNKL